MSVILIKTFKSRSNNPNNNFTLYQWRSKGGGVGKWGHAPRGAGIRGALAHFLHSFKNKFLSRNLDQSMLKNAYFLENNCTNRFSVESQFASSGCYSCLLLQLLRVCF